MSLSASMDTDSTPPGNTLSNPRPAAMIRRPSSPPPAAPVQAPPLEDDDLLEEILRRFRKQIPQGTVFNPTLDAPDRILALTSLSAAATGDSRAMAGTPMKSSQLQQVPLLGDVDKQVKVPDAVGGQVHDSGQEGNEVHHSGQDVEKQRRMWDAMDPRTATMIRRRRPSSPPPAAPAQAPPLEDDDLLEEILLRLPPQPSSLPRASPVCTRWRSLLSNARFLRRFRKHHRKQIPLLGCFSEDECGDTNFDSTLDAPDSIPASRFPVPRPPESNEHWSFEGFRHGLAVILNWTHKEVVLWHPLTGHQRRVPYPPWFGSCQTCRAWVLCAAAAGDEDGHVPGECHLHPFKLAFISCKFLSPTELRASLYASESAAWGDMITTPMTSSMYNNKVPYVMDGNAVMAGNALFWLFPNGETLEFDLESESLGVIEKPAGAPPVDDDGGTLCSWQAIRTEDGGLGLAVLLKEELSIQLWQRRCNCNDRVVGWEPQKRIPLDELLTSTLLKVVRREFPGANLARIMGVQIVGYDEDTNVIVLATRDGDFTLQLDLLKFKQFTDRYIQDYTTYYPYSSFYTTGRGVDGGAEV